MFGLITRLLAGPLVSKLADLFISYQNRKGTEAEFRAAVEATILQTFKEVSESQADVIKTELEAEGWLQRNWRPVTALLFTFIVFFYGLLSPVLVAWWDFPPVKVGDILLGWIMDAVLICLGGYIGGRSLEKIVKMIVRR